MTKIMIIEDDQAVVQELEMHLGYLYCDVVSVTDSGKKALEALKRVEPDVILMDISLDMGLATSSLSSAIAEDKVYRENIYLEDSTEPGTLTLCRHCNVLYYNFHSLENADQDETSSYSTEGISPKEYINSNANTVLSQAIYRQRQIPIVLINRHMDDKAFLQIKMDFLFCYVLTPISTRDLQVAIDMALHAARVHTQRMIDHRELERSDERYKTLVDNMASGVAIYKVVGDGEDFIFLDFNKAAEKIDKQKREELIGKSIFDARPGIIEFGLVEIFKKVWKTGKPHHLHTSLYKDERITRYYENYVYKLSSGEIVSLFSDETLKKSSELEMKKLEAQLQHAQKMEAIGTMAGGIAHDFNNILFPILGFSELMLQDDIDKITQKEFLTQILKAGNRAKELVKQILTFSRQQSSEVRPLAIQHIIKEIIKLSRAMLPSTITIDHNISPDCGMVMADPTQIHQVIMNLITNAFHAMEDSGGILTIRLYETEDFNKDSGTIRHNGKYVCIEVSDTGTGMDESIKQKIFDPYFTTKEKNKGTGLGLAVVHGIVKGYNGDIVVKTAPLEGTSFKIYIPEIPKDEHTMSEPSNLKKYNGKETILVVDDEPVVARIFSLILEKAGYKVFLKTDSIEALNSFRENPSKYDLVITDLTMPEMTGDRLCTALKMTRPDIPVILCTGFSREEAGFKHIADTDEILMKPVISQQLLKAVRKLLDKVV